MLRPMHWSDIAGIAVLEGEVFPGEAWDERSWWAELAQRPRRHYVVLQDDGAAGPLLGYAGLDFGPDVADVMTIAVAPSARGAGHGRTLLRHLLEVAGAAGLTRVMLEVRADNDAALALYRDHGFTVLRVRPRYYPGGGDALVLERDAAAPSTVVLAGRGSERA